MKRASMFYSLALLMTAILSLPAFGQITPSDDAYTLTSSPTKNFGTANTLEVESSGATTFIRFDLSGIPSSVNGSMVAKGTLKIFVGTVTTPGSFNIDLVTSSWAEKTITANSEPTLGSAVASAIPVTTADKDQYILVDVTAAVVDWLNGTANDGLAIVPDGTVSFTLNSKETTTTSHPPELDIVLTGPQGPPGSISGVTAGPGLTGGGTKGNVTLSMLTSCSKSQLLQWSGTTWACSNAGTGTVTGVTAGTDLTGGGTGGSVTLNVDTTKIPQLSSSNTFTAFQSITGNSSNNILNVTQNATSGPGFGVVGTSYNNNRGQAAVLGQEMATSSAGVFGVEGFIGSLNGAGVYGQDSNPQSSVGNATAVSAGVWGDSGGGTSGVLGTSTNFSSVVGLNSSSASAAIFAENQNTGSSVLAPGIFGISFAPKGIAVVGSGPVHSNNFINNAGFNPAGVVGDSAATGGIGVWGSTDSGTSVYGSTNTGTGVYGLSNSGSGVVGSSTSQAGVVGTSSGSGNAGVYGLTNNTNGADPAAAVWGDDPTTGGGNYGVYGYSQAGIGVYGVSESSSVFVQAGRFDAPNGAYPFAAVGPSGNCFVQSNGDLVCTGSKSAAVPLPDSRWVRLYAVESPENWFEDFGSGTLSNGSASVALDPTFRDTVTSSQDYHVFLTPRGECEGLYIASTNASGFEVRELHHGKSNIAFDYRIVVRRKGYENIRMEDVTEVQGHLAAKKEILRQPHHKPAIVEPASSQTRAEVELPVPVRPNQSSHPNKQPTVLPAQRPPSITKR